MYNYSLKGNQCTKLYYIYLTSINFDTKLSDHIFFR